MLLCYYVLMFNIKINGYPRILVWSWYKNMLNINIYVLCRKEMKNNQMIE